MSIEVKTSQRGRKSKLTQKNLDDIKALIFEQPDITIHKIRQKLNLTEKMWSKLKAILRKLKARSSASLPDAIKSAFKLVTADDCHGWFDSVGVS